VGHTGCGAVTATYDELTDGLDEPAGIEHCIGLLVPRLEAGVEALPDGLLDVLAIMGRDAAPVILDGVHAFERWAQTRSLGLDSIPRAVGTFESRLRGLPLERFTGAYALWMLQRTLDSLADLSKADRARVDAALAGTGWEPLLAHAPRPRLAKRGFELVFV